VNGGDGVDDRLSQAEAILAECLASVGEHGRIEIESVCAAHPALAAELRCLLPLMQAILGQRGSQTPVPGRHAALWARLEGAAGAADRYIEVARVDDGGMGRIDLVHDQVLQREVARKRLLLRDRPGDAVMGGLAAALTRRRFLDEAQIAGRLEHPGIVPVHDLFLDADGAVAFTMRYVRGRSFQDVLNDLARGGADWTTAGALQVLQRVAETMAYAHSQGVVHRDLKPANIMVGGFGEVYVVDWGLAGRIGALPAAAEEADPLRTQAGQVVGTPAYMPPEQAAGEWSLVDHRADVYALGAVLYHLLTGTPPYVDEREPASSMRVLRRVRQGSPKALPDLAPDADDEIVAICARAMARDRDHRYVDMQAFAADLRAYQEGRVVTAHPTGAWGQLHKWVARNLALAAALAFGLVAVMVGGAASYWQAERARTAQQLAEDKARAVLSLSAMQDVRELVAEVDALWPPYPDRLGAYADWIARARVLVDGVVADGLSRQPGLHEHEAALAALRTRATPDPAVEGGYRFPHREDAWWYQQLGNLVDGLRDLQDPERGLLSLGASAEHGWGIGRRQAFAAEIGERSVSGPDAARLWAETRTALAASARYGGLRMEPQLGLLPLGPDPDSGLFEFAHLQSGAAPLRGADGKLAFDVDSGIVFVLIPGGIYLVGAQSIDPRAPHYDAAALPEEGPVHEVELSPFFLSKYEMTQAQWERLHGVPNACYMREDNYKSIWNRWGKSFSKLLPVEQVSAPDCERLFARAGIRLPTEAEWETACRSGSDQPFWCGGDLALLAASSNVADDYARRHDSENWDGQKESWDDGHTYCGEVHAFLPNHYGIVGCHGNVWEWCQDGYDAEFYAKSPRQDPVCPTDGLPERSFRGGGFDYSAKHARASYRFRFAPDSRMYAMGVRPARSLSAR